DAATTESANQNKKTAVCDQSAKWKRRRRYTRSTSGNAAAIIQDVNSSDAADTRNTAPFTVAANSGIFFSPNSRAKNGSEAWPTACPSTAMGTAKSRLA